MRNAKGFTLIELLIAISIIFILVAALMPNLLAARQRANDALVASYMGDVMKFQEIHYIDHNTYTANWANLFNLGLKPVPRNVDVGFTFVSVADYCLVGRHRAGSSWFAAKPDKGVYNTNTPVNQPHRGCP
jgi:prepilin-type N-terminal cleavage/methylation domain-containing protein